MALIVLFQVPQPFNLNAFFVGYYWGVTVFCNFSFSHFYEKNQFKPFKNTDILGQ